jgi:hypothetical protein
MAASGIDPAVAPRPAAVWVTTGVLAFLGVSAVAGGTAMLTGVDGAAPPQDWLADVPVVDSWVLPGLVLAVGFGLGSLITAYGMLSRRSWAWSRPVEGLVGYHWSWLAALLLGLGQVIWIGLEVAYLPELSRLQVVYATAGFALLLFPSLRSVRSYLAWSGPAGVGPMPGPDGTFGPSP